MTQPDKLLSVDEIQRATKNGNTFFAQLAMQLLDTMHDNEKLREALAEIKSIAGEPECVYNICKQALSIRISDNG